MAAATDLYTLEKEIHELETSLQRRESWWHINDDRYTYAKQRIMYDQKRLSALKKLAAALRESLVE
ncbi:MAG: hypothetical protein ACUVTU_00950 [Desulfurispora sp.]|uniref:hypothetical protein n=1 Tax=Desulfurispora sp. TaxID=3014275 RepID=UPI00404A7C20